MARGASLNYVNAKSVRSQPQFSAIDKSRNLFILGVSFLLTLLIIGSIFYIGTHTKVVNLGYKINDEIKKKEQLIEESKRLELEIARLKSPTRIEFEAKEKLGMSLVNSKQVIYLSKLDDPKNFESLANDLRGKTDVVPKPSPQVAAAAISPEKTKNRLQVAQKVSRKNKEIKSDNPGKKLTKKENPQVLLAKIVSGEAKGSPSEQAKTTKTTKERLPAVMLDPFP